MIEDVVHLEAFLHRIAAGPRDILLREQSLPARHHRLGELALAIRLRFPAALLRFRRCGLVVVLALAGIAADPGRARAHHRQDGMSEDQLAPRAPGVDVAADFRCFLHGFRE